MFTTQREHLFEIPQQFQSKDGTYIVPQDSNVPATAWGKIVLNRTIAWFKEEPCEPYKRAIGKTTRAADLLIQKLFTKPEEFHLVSEDIDVCGNTSQMSNKELLELVQQRLRTEHKREVYVFTKQSSLQGEIKIKLKEKE